VKKKTEIIDAEYSIVDASQTRAVRPREFGAIVDSERRLHVDEAGRFSERQYVTVVNDLRPLALIYGVIAVLFIIASVNAGLFAFFGAIFTSAVVWVLFVAVFDKKQVRVR
jgi:hypothetical protein